MSQRETIISSLEALCLSTGYAVTTRPASELADTDAPQLVIVPADSSVAPVAGGVWGHTLTVAVSALGKTSVLADTALAAVLSALSVNDTLSGALHGPARVLAVGEAVDAARIVRHGRQAMLSLYYETARWSF